MNNPLLVAGEPAPFSVVNPGGRSSVVLVCDHASNRVPHRLSHLGLQSLHLESHIAWDPGAAQVARALSAELDAALILSNYSRLVIDCNRPLISPESIPEYSAGILIPGNRQLSSQQRELRIESFFLPYHRAIADLLDKREDARALLSIHSFTPEFNAEERPWHIGVAHYRDDSLARSLFTALRQPGNLVVGLNQPYAIETEYDYTVPRQGEARGLASAMIEIRQDLLEGSSQAECWAQRLALAWRCCLNEK